MNIDQLDEKLITEPMSKTERIKLINAFLNSIYLRGIDKGTHLEKSRQKRVDMVKSQRAGKKFDLFLEMTEELITIYEKRAYREKYKGRYCYYVPKKARKKKPPVDKRPATKQLKIW